MNYTTSIPAQTLVMIGKKLFRTSDEPSGKEANKYPELTPVTFVDYSGVSILELMHYAGGSQGCVVPYQREIRDNTDQSKVNAWRAYFNDDAELRNQVIDNAISFMKSSEHDELINEIIDGHPFVIINFNDAGKELTTPLRPVDMIEVIRTKVPFVYNTFLAELDDDEQLEKVPELYQNVIIAAQNMK